MEHVLDGIAIKRYHLAPALEHGEADGAAFGDMTVLGSDSLLLCISLEKVLMQQAQL